MKPQQNYQLIDEPAFILDNLETPERSKRQESKMWLLMFWLLACYGLTSLVMDISEVVLT